MHRYYWLPVLVLAAACGQAPSEGPPKTAKPVEKLSSEETELKSLSEELFRAYRSMRDGASISCSWKDALGKVEIGEKDPQVKAFVGEWTAKDEALCMAKRAAINGLIELAREAKPGGLPNLYEFLYYEPTSTGGGGLFVEESIGPFRVLGDCQAIEAQVRKAGVGTRSCAVWQAMSVKLQQLFK